jgi:glutamate-5-semialdehyde dehydrogenase
VGLPAALVQIIESTDHATVEQLVSMPDLVPVVVIRGSGPTTKTLSRIAAAHGVHALAHADGGGVLYVHSAARTELGIELVLQSLDRLGVCNRLNLLLVDTSIWAEFVPRALRALESIGVKASLPPHDHPLGHEWAVDDARQATVTIAPADGPRQAVGIAETHTSGIAASIVTDDERAASEFLDRWTGTGGFWNATTRLLDGFKLTGAPETGINVGHTLGPRGPVTYRDLYLRQYRIIPADDH